MTVADYSIITIGILVLKIAFLYLGIMWTVNNSIRMILKNSIPAFNIRAQAIGITGFIVLQWLI